MSKKQFHLFIQACILILLVLFAFIYILIVNKNLNFSIYFLSIFMLGNCIWIVFSWRRLTGSYFDPYIIFISAAILFNGGHIILKVFSLNSNGILAGDHLLAGPFPDKIILETIYLVVLGLNCFHFGSLLSIRRKYYFEKIDKINFFFDKKICRRVGLLLLLIAVIPSLLIYIKAIKIALIGGYDLVVSYSSSMGYGSFFRILSKFLVPGSLFLLAGSKNNKRGIILSLAVICLYTGAEFFLGSRSSAVGALVAYTWVWNQSIYSIPKFILLPAGGITLFVVLPLIRVSRKLLGSTNLSFEIFINAYTSIENPAISIISEMGNSMGAIAHTLSLVPNEKFFNLGTNYFYALSSVFPNFFWEIHPSTNHIPSEWLSKEINPSILAEGRGLGFSFIAEAYLNFGWIGVPLILGLLGFLFGGLVIWAKSSNYLSRTAMVASFFSFSFIFVRGAFIQIVRPLFWYSLIPYILIILTRDILLGKIQFK